jgi:epoxyqueuosine reductase
VKEYNNLQIFDLPIIGIASAEDDLFDRLKEVKVVGNHHLSPKEWFPEAKSIISYFLPFTETVRKGNRIIGQPAKEWLYGRYEGEIFNDALRKMLTDWFHEKKIKAISPGIDLRFKVLNMKSNWSERHIAYIAGLETMRLSCSIITKKGSAGRLGSIIVESKLKKTTRTYRSINEYCIMCGSCIFRCPPMAITEERKDHSICKDYYDRTLTRYKPRYGCGKCQTAVPCEKKIPKR